MNASLDEAVKEAYALAPANVSHVHSLELRHPSIQTSMFIVQGFLNRELTIENDVVQIFKAVPFAFKLPGSGASGLQELSLTIDNVDNKAADFLELAMNFPDPVQVIYRPYLSTDLTSCKMDPPLRLVFTNASIDAAQISGRATPADFLNRKFLSELYTRKLFPALGSL